MKNQKSTLRLRSGLMVSKAEPSKIKNQSTKQKVLCSAEPINMGSGQKLILKRILPKIKENISLANYTTFRIGGPAKYFFEAKNKKDIIKAILVAKKMRLPFFILGGGSNILVADEGYNGLAIKIQNSPKESLRFSTGQAKFKTIYTGAGIPLSLVISEATKKGLTGLEWAIGIPGTVGGMIYGNAGAFGRTIGEVVDEVEFYDIKNQKIKILKRKDCKFGYRDSIFNRKKGGLIILSAALKLKKGDKKGIQEKIKNYSAPRRETQPLNYPSAGSVFKNPSSFSAGPHTKSFGVGAGELIEKCGLKGKRIGNAKISEKHANFVINLGGAKATDVKKLINLAKNKVKNKFKIKLKEEVQYL